MNMLKENVFTITQKAHLFPTQTNQHSPLQTWQRERERERERERNNAAAFNS